MSVREMNKILQQGHLDGFCLQYTVVNAFKALKYPTKTANWFVENQKHVWEKLVMVTPSLHNFASGKGSYFGCSTDKTDVILHERFLDLCAAAVSDKKKEHYSIRRIVIEDVSEAITKDSVVILCLRQEVSTKRCSIGDHWVCVVDTDDKDFQLACSYSEYLPKLNREEFLGDDVSHGFKRPFNNAIAMKDVNKNKVFENSVYRFEMMGN